MKRTIFALLVVLSAAMIACTDDDEYAVNIMPPSLEEQIEKEYIRQHQAEWDMLHPVYKYSYRHYYDLWKDGKVLLTNREINSIAIMTIAEVNALELSQKVYRVPQYSLYSIDNSLNITLRFFDYFSNYGELPQKSYLHIASRDLVLLSDLQEGQVFSLTADGMEFYKKTSLRTPTKLYWYDGDSSKGIVIYLYSEDVFPYTNYPDLSAVSVYKIIFAQLENI